MKIQMIHLSRIKEKFVDLQLTRWALLFALIAGISLSASCDPWSDTRNAQPDRADLISYAFDSTTILDSLDRGDEVVFPLIEAGSEPTAFPSSRTVLYSQSDTIKIARAFIEKVWSEPYDELKLFNMILTTDCSLAPEGKFNGGELQYYKVTKSDGVTTRDEYFIQIVPERNMIVTLWKNFRSKAVVVHPIDWLGYQFSAEEALQIVEANGGAESRLKLDDNCRITILTSGSREIGWRISYSQFRDGWWDSFFEVNIDPSTGEFKPLFPRYD